FLPVLGAMFIGALGHYPNLRETATMVTSISLFLLVASLWPTIQSGTQPEIVLAEPIPGLALMLTVEPLGYLFGLLASFLWIFTSIYAIGYMRGHGEQNQTRFFIFFAISIGSAIGVAFAGNLFTLFVFYEVLSLATFPLVTHSGTEEAKKAGRVYLGILLGTSIGLQLPAIIWTWSITGTLDFTEGGIFDPSTSPLIISALVAMYVFGIGKAAVMPFHRWLPAAMVAPTPVSALLHAVAVVKAGVFSILKISIYIFGIDLLDTTNATEWLVYVAGATIIIASIVAMSKDNLKARLAYSTVSQLSYIVLGAMLATSWGVIGSGLHIIAHAFGKITLFFCAGAILVAAHKTEVSQLRGIGRKMPITMGAFFVGSLTVIGLPPTGNMWSKWYLALGTLETEQYVLLGVLMVSALLNIAYILVIPIRGFFLPLDDKNDNGDIKEAPLPCLIALVVTAMGSIALFFFPDPFYDLLKQIAGS
ncbi:monovalent cation/H+ antiporter subunit D family protein, partial [Pseudomonadota bacterium]